MKFRKNSLILILFMVLVCCADAVGSVYGNIVNKSVSGRDSVKNSIPVSFMINVIGVDQVSAWNTMNFDVEKAVGVDYSSASNARRIVGHSNNIVVNNTNPYTSGDYAFGISYCQSTDSEHYYYIYQNDVTVYNGDYTIYLIQADDGSFINNNVSLIAHAGNATKTGNDTIYAPDLGFNG